MTQSKSKRTIWRKFRHTMLYSCMLASASMAQAGVSDVPSGLSEQSWQSIQAQISAAPIFEQEGQILQNESDREEQNHFGFSIAIEGDTLVVGANGTDNQTLTSTHVPQGAVYIFSRNAGGEWIEKAKLITAPTVGSFLNTKFLVPFFGTSVALEGNTLVVGAPNIPEEVYNGLEAQKSAVKVESGAAYVYIKNNEGVWEFSKKLQAGNGELYDGFGNSVAISGNTVIVGAVGEDSSEHAINSENNDAKDSGAAYVFTGSGANWTQQAYIKATNIGVGDQFGWSVAVSGNTVVVGAHLEDGDENSGKGSVPGGGLVGPNDNASNAGVAYVYSRDVNTWTLQGYLKAEDAGAGHELGRSISISGDSIIAGAVGVDGLEGAAYVFVKDNTTGIWSQQAKVKANTPEIGSQFGKFVTLNNDTAIIGAYKETNVAKPEIVEAGAAYVFTRNNGSWTQQERLETTDPKETGRFGTSIAFSGNTLMVGAHREDGGVEGPRVGTFESGSGAVYAYSLKGLYLVGGNVSGLTGTGLVLQNNLTDDFSIAGSGGFFLNSSLVNGSTYSVTVKTQPSGQECVVTNGTGTINGSNVDDVAVACSDLSFVRCDVTGEGDVNITDVVGIINIVLSGGAIEKGSDCNADTKMNVLDVVKAINVVLNN